MTTHVLDKSQGLLRLALRVDAVVTGINGLAYLALAKPLHSLLDLPVGLGLSLGAFLVVFAAVVWAIARPATIERSAAQAVIELNLVWAVLSVVTLAAGWLPVNTIGGVWAVLQAVVVAGFAALQYAGLRQSGGLDRSR